MLGQKYGGDDITLETEYKGYKIKYDEQSEKFRAQKDGEDVYSSEKLRTLKEKIDHHEKTMQKKKFKRVKALKETYGDYREYEPIEITSVASLKGGIPEEVWVKYLDSGYQERGKEYLHHIYEDSEENRERAEKIAELKKQAEALKNEAKELENAMTNVDPKSLLVE